jgi:hypothetical protein
LSKRPWRKPMTITSEAYGLRYVQILQKFVHLILCYCELSYI